MVAELNLRLVFRCRSCLGGRACSPAVRLRAVDSPLPKGACFRCLNGMGRHFKDFALRLMELQKSQKPSLADRGRCLRPYICILSFSPGAEVIEAWVFGTQRHDRQAGLEKTIYNVASDSVMNAGRWNSWRTARRRAGQSAAARGLI